MRVLIAPDKFKGTLAALDVAKAIAKGWKKVRPRDELILFPISDGGDGFGELTARGLNARKKVVSTVDAAHQPIKADIFYTDTVAVVEAAKSNGLALLQPGKFHPFQLDTYGVARLLLSVEKMGIRRCLAGVGGSATNDGGFGMAVGLGFRFLDRSMREISRWPELSNLSTIIPPAKPLKLSVKLAVDVQNPLLGKQGCTRIYGPQKGIGKQDIASAEKALTRLSKIVQQTFGEDYANVPGAGAAGGLGFGFLSFVSATAVSGFELFAKTTGLNKEMAAADLVVTGEGSLDYQTVMGKGVGELNTLCRKRHIPCLALAGKIDDVARPAFEEAIALVDLTSISDARANPAKWLEIAAQNAASGFK